VNTKPYARELLKTGGNLGIDTILLSELESERYIKRVLGFFRPYKTTGHLSIGTEKADFLIAVNWYVINVAGTAIDSLKKLIVIDSNDKQV
jgi:hypothetical protein